MSAHKNIGASVRARLLNRAKDNGSDYGLILTKYALERILYRLSVSQWSDAFLLKGALLFDLWFDHPWHWNYSLHRSLLRSNSIWDNRKLLEFNPLVCAPPFFRKFQGIP